MDIKETFVVSIGTDTDDVCAKSNKEKESCNGQLRDSTPYEIFIVLQTARKRYCEIHRNCCFHTFNFCLILREY